MHTEQQHCHVAVDALYGIRHAELYSYAQLILNSA